MFQALDVFSGVSSIQWTEQPKMDININTYMQPVSNTQSCTLKQPQLLLKSP